MTSYARPSILARLAFDKTGAAAAFGPHLPTKPRFQMAAQLHAELRHLRPRNPAPRRPTGPPKPALTRPVPSLSHRRGEGRGEGARCNSPSLFQPRRRIRISEPALTFHDSPRLVLPRRLSRSGLPLYGAWPVWSHPDRRPFSIFASNLPLVIFLRITTNSPSTCYAFRLFAWRNFDFQPSAFSL